MKILRTDETIVAQASAKGWGLRGIVRISGPLCLEALHDLFHAKEVIVSRRPQIVSGQIFFGEEKVPVPGDLYFWPEGHGFTRQMSVELHMPGNRPLIDWMIKTLCQNGCRLAEPGEFTLRAFLAGRIDLSQAEAVLGVIDSKDENELKLALTQLAGGLKFPLERIHKDIMDILSHLEAEFDFAEEEIEFIERDVMKQTIRQVLDAIDQIQTQIEHRAGTSELPKVALVGAPNAGKSSLFNVLTRKAARSPHFHTGAIVSEHSGTTRDYLECECVWQNVCFQLVDTAGMTETHLSERNDSPDVQAQMKTRESLDAATILIVCRPWQEENSPVLFTSAMQKRQSVVTVRTKADHFQASEISDEFVTSAKTMYGLDALLDRIVILLKRSQPPLEVLPSTALRCREMLEAASSALIRALSLEDDLLVAAELRHAWEQIGLITGTTFHDALLDQIFSRFCIGK